METWKDIKNYEGYYQVSDLGNVRSLDRIGSDGHKYKGKPLKPYVNRLGYKMVYLSRHNAVERLLVHRLVAETFIKKPSEECNIVNHLDNNPSNNKTNNLEWTTYSGNLKWAAVQGRIKYHPENLKKAQEAKKRPVIATDRNGFRYYFESQTEAKTILGIKSGNISASCRKESRYKTVGGFTWEYAKEKRSEEYDLNLYKTIYNRCR